MPGQRKRGTAHHFDGFEDAIPDRETMIHDRDGLRQRIGQQRTIHPGVHDVTLRARCVERGEAPRSQPAGLVRILQPPGHRLLFHPRCRSRVWSPDWSLQADIAQLVERNLAKVEVASSSLVVRSERVSADPSAVGWPRGEATDCKSVYTGSNPVPTSNVEQFYGRLAQR